MQKENLSIISLVPSITETLIDLGLAVQIIGRTKFCIHPAIEVRDIPTFGGTKNPHIDKIILKKPNLIIANKEENRKEDIERLRDAEIEVLVTDVWNVDSAIDMIMLIGHKTDTLQRAQHLAEAIQEEWGKIVYNDSIKACYLIWKSPFMSVGGDTYIHDVLKKVGFENICAAERRYPEVNLRSIKSDILLLSSEPYPFKQSDALEIESQYGIKSIVVDGEAFSWYGSHMLKSLPYLRALREKISTYD